MNIETEINNFKKQIENNSLTHAYIVSGGEYSDRKNFIDKILDLVYETSEDEVNISNPDVFTLDIDYIRKITKNDKTEIYNIKTIKEEVIPFLSKSSTGGKLKTLVVFESERFTIESINAFLKILEEPSKDSLIILDVIDYHLLPNTIRSRVSVINITSNITYTNEEIENSKDFLRNIFTNENSTFKNNKYFFSLVLKDENKNDVDIKKLNRYLTCILTEIVNRIKEYSSKNEKGKYYFRLIKFINVINDTYKKAAIKNINIKFLVNKMILDLYLIK